MKDFGQLPINWVVKRKYDLFLIEKKERILRQEGLNFEH